MSQPPFPPPSSYPDPASEQQPSGSYGRVQDAPASPYLSGYGAPDSYTAYVPPSHPTTPVLGRVALAAGVVALLGSLVNAVIVRAFFDPASLEGANGGAAHAMTSIFLVQALVLWFGFGLWAIVQGIVAIAQNRGRTEGVVALVLGFVGPWVGVTLALVAIGEAFART